MKIGAQVEIEIGHYPVAFTCSKLTKKPTRAGCEIWSKLTLKTQARSLLRRSVVFIVNFEHISQLLLVFLLLILSRLMPAGDIIDESY